MFRDHPDSDGWRWVAATRPWRSRGRVRSLWIGEKTREWVWSRQLAQWVQDHLVVDGVPLQIAVVGRPVATMVVDDTSSEEEIFL